MDTIQSTTTETPAKALTAVWRWSLYMEVLGWLVGIGGIITGIILAAHSVHVGEDYSTVEAHPFVGLGIGVLIGSLVLAVLFCFLSTWASAWAESVDPRVAQS